MVDFKKARTQATLKKKTATTKTRATTSKQVKFPPFMTADDLNGRTKFRVLPWISIYLGNNGATSLFIQVENQKHEVYTWTMRTGSPDRISMQQAHGRNLLDWIGKVIELMPVNGSQGGRFVNLYDPTRQQTAREVSNDDIPF